MDQRPNSQKLRTEVLKVSNLLDEVQIRVIQSHDSPGFLARNLAASDMG